MLLAAVLLVLTGCGSDGEVAQVPEGASPRPGPSDLARTPTRGAEQPAPEELVRGTVVAGVEQGCLLLRSAGAEHLLVGGDRALMVPGAQLEVRGRTVPDLLTTCQQGVPFEVSSAVAVPA